MNRMKILSNPSSMKFLSSSSTCFKRFNFQCISSQRNLYCSDSTSVEYMHGIVNETHKILKWIIVHTSGILTNYYVFWLGDDLARAEVFGYIYIQEVFPRVKFPKIFFELLLQCNLELWIWNYILFFVEFLSSDKLKE